MIEKLHVAVEGVESSWRRCVLLKFDRLIWDGRVEIDACSKKRGIE